ncbi:MAG: hypothetical protein RMM98_14990 [Acidobacteriota bacterium]|nr:hypothetical protein [Blastocatellia bacterium]MDW8240912.1 hypothetical protein [Acidobacteriota bacterium]
MPLTVAHWVYAGFVILVVMTMAMRRDPLIPCIIGAFTLGWVIKGTLLGAVQTVFISSVVATRELLDIILVISLIVGLTAGLERIGADRLMVAPAQKWMRSPEVAFWVIGIVMLVASYFIWPSPATALVGAVLVPAARAVGLPAISVAVAMNLFGHGIALSTDYVIQGAPNISAKAANVPVEAVMRAGIPLIGTMAIVTLTAAFIVARRDITRAALGQPQSDETAMQDLLETSSTGGACHQPTSIARIAAVVVPLSYLAIVVVLTSFGIRGADATAIIGGVTLLLLSIFTLLSHGLDSFDLITEHLIKGFSFGMKVFTPVIIIASFFYLGSHEIARHVFGEWGRGLLFDLASALSAIFSLNRITVPLIETVVGGIVGLVGSGFSGLPLTGSLAGAFAAATDLKPATLAALGQIATVWVGGGCIIPWGVIPVAAVCRVSPQELAGKNFIPVMLGLLATTVVAVFLA